MRRCQGDRGAGDDENAIVIVALGCREANMMLTAEACKAQSVNCATLGRADDISQQRATVLLAMARSWNNLAGQTERYQELTKAEHEEELGLSVIG